MTFRIAACQMNSRPDKEANLQTVARLIDRAAAAGAQMVALPEYFNLYGTMPDVIAGAEPIPGPSSQLQKEKAQKQGIYDVAQLEAEERI